MLTAFSLFTFYCMFLGCHGELPEEKLSVPKLIRYWNYPAESHEVLTKDGYYLTLHRIPYGKEKYGNKQKILKKRPVFFLQHGLICSSSNWVTNPPAQSLGFMLADAGYDVWMGNVRGNTYSRRHKKFSIESDEFWDFSFDEMAKYDLPAMIDYVLNKTDQKTLYYAGHSQGTMIAFAGLIENKDLNSKIKHFFALAPVAHLGNANSPITYLSYFESEIGGFYKMFGVKEFLPSNDSIVTLANEFCGFESIVCSNILFIIAGSDEVNMNVTRIPIYLAHTPAGTSVRDMLHFAQLVKAGQFQKYDYGYFGNLKKYRSLFPPTYDLSKISVPVSLFWGTRDTLADPEDVKWIKGQLKGIKHDVKISGYNHLDFIWGISARNKVYKKIINFVRKDTSY